MASLDMEGPFKFGASPSDEQIQLFLRDKANVDITEANRIAKEVGKLFKKVVGYLKIRDEKSSTNAEGGDKKGLVNEEYLQPPMGDQWVLISPYGKTEIKDRISFVAATTLLSALKEKYPKPNEEERGGDSQ